MAPVARRRRRCKYRTIPKQRELALCKDATDSTRLGEAWEGAQKDGSAQLREARRKLAGQRIVFQLPAMSSIVQPIKVGNGKKNRQPQQSQLYSPMHARELHNRGPRGEAYKRAKRWAHRRSPISGIVPNKPKPAKLMSHSASGQSAEQFH